MLGLRYKCVDFGVKKSPGSHNWWAQIDLGRARSRSGFSAIRLARTPKRFRVSGIAFRVSDFQKSLGVRF